VRVRNFSLSMERWFEVLVVYRPMFYSASGFYSLSVEIRPGMFGLLCEIVMPLKLAGATAMSLSDRLFWCLVDRLLAISPCAHAFR